MDKRFNEQREEMKALLKRYKDVIVERASEFKRNSEGKKLSTKRLMSALVATVLASVGGVATIVSNSNDVRESIKNMEDKQIEEMYESTPEDAVVKYVYTTLYSQLPDRNTLDELSSGRIIKYTKGNEEVWQQNENKSINFLKVDEVIAPEQLIEGENEDAAVENINNTMEYNKSELYILKENIEEYVECMVLVDELKFRKSPDPDLENSPRFANEGTLYVYKDSEGIGEYQYKKAILVDKDGSIDYGYVADTEGRLEEKSSGACIGMVKQGTFVRSSAMLPEYEESVVAGTLYNGDVIEVTGKPNNYYYECKIEGDDNTYYIRNNTVILDSQFDYDITVEGTTVMHGFNNDGSITTRKNGEGEDIEVAKGDGMVVDLSTSKDGLYAVWDKDKKAVGYLYGDDIYVSKLGKSVAEMLDPKSINEKNMEEAQKSREHKEISMDSKDDKPTIVLDFKKISLDDMEKVINHCKENNIDLGGVIFSIGSTNSPLGSQTFRMPHMADGKGESEVQNAWDQMKELSKLELKGTNNGRANTAELLEIIELLIDNDIAVGLYYYSAPINETEVSCEAAYIYTIVKYLNENSEKFRNYTKKFPISIDVENGLQGGSFNVSRENEQNTRRAELTQKLIELLNRHKISIDCCRLVILAQMVSVVSYILSTWLRYASVSQPVHKLCY